MATCFHRFLRDESGLVITAELIMIITIGVLSLVAGWGAVSSMLAEELEDVANSLGSLNQSFNYGGLSAPGHATCSGSGFIDSRNSVNVSTSSNFNASVAGLDFTPVIPQFQGSAFAVESAVAEEQFALVEEEFGINVQIDQVLLLELVEFGIVTVREDGSIVLLREDLIEICDDGSIRIRREAIEHEAIELRQPVTRPQEHPVRRPEKPTARRLQPQVQCPTPVEDLQRMQTENARLKELIEQLSRKVDSKD
jgi:Flp pilus assembly pilin Flp